MKKPKKNILCVLFLLIFFTATVTAKPIQLESREFDPGKMEKGLSTNGMSVQSTTPGKQRMIIQFSENPSDKIRENLEASGLSFHSYIPENAWLVTVDGSPGEIRSKENVVYLGPLQTSDKIGKHLRKKLGNSVNKVNATVVFFSDRKNPEKLISRYGEVERRLGQNTWEVSSSESGIQDLARKTDVKQVSLSPPGPETHNDDARKLIGVENLQISENLTGSGFTAAIWDSGWAGEHSDLNYTGKRVVGDKGENCGNGCTVKQHGTHVAGTMLGGGILDSTFRGMAPDSRVVTYEWPASNITELYEETDHAINNYNSVVSQNSWGYQIDSGNQGLMGDYTGMAQEYDTIISNTTSQVTSTLSVVFSAGNEGNDHSFRYNTTTGAGATSKNTITVGAVGDNGKMTPYSSWGPTDDGRIKPDLVADGGRNSAGDYIFSTLPGNSYGGTQGTSMAAPGVSGAVILLNQKFNRTHQRLPETDTVKNALIHTARDINRTGPDYITGWGLVNATDAADYVEKSSSRSLLESGKLSPAEQHSYTVEIDEGEDVKFTLAWNDYPGDTSAAKKLVNDLDLVVEDGSSNRKYPWSLNWSSRTEPASRDKEDHTNNVEQVYIENTTAGVYNITVSGANIPEPDQDYSLALARESQPVKPPVLSVKSPGNRNYSQTPEFTLKSNEALSEAVFSIDGGPNRSMTEVNSTYFTDNSASLSDGSHNVVFYASDTAGNWNSSSENFRIDSTPPSIDIVSPENSSTVSGTTDISAAITDASKIDSTTYKIFQNSSKVSSGGLNDSIDTTTLADGEYDISYSATDSLNNSAQENISVTVSNSMPTIKNWQPSNHSNLSGSFDVKAAVTDDSDLEYRRFLVENSSGLQLNKSLNGSVDSKNLADGSYSLDLVAEDIEGNRNSVNLEINIRNQAPEITVFSPSNNSAITDNTDIYAGVDVETASSGYTLENQTGQIVSGEFNTSLNTSTFQDGNYNISYTATDHFSNTVEKKMRIEIDNTPPSLNLTEPSSDLLNKVFKVEAVWKDNLNSVEEHSYTLSDSNGDLTSGSLNNSINSTFYSDGDYSLSYAVEDSLGNRQTIQKQIQIDNTPPEISSATISDGEVFSGNFTVDAQTSDTSGIENSSYTLRNGSGEQKSGSLGEKIVSDDYRDGNYTLEIKAWDMAGNQNKQAYDVTLDNTKPELNLFLPERDSNISESFLIEATAVDNSSNIVSLKFQINDSSGNITGELNSSLDSSNLQNGEHKVFYTAEDQAGNLRTANRTFTVDNEKPAIQTVEPSSRFISENISVTGIWSDNSTGIKTANYTLINSTGIQSSGRLNSSIQTSNLSEGTYNLSLKAYDYVENSEISSNILEIDRTPPSVDSITPESGENISGTLNISASASDDRSLAKTVYRLENSTGKVTDYRELSKALDSAQFSDGDYSLVVKSNDSAGNSITSENSDISIDNSPPSVSLEIFNGSKTSGEWIKDNSTVEVSCTDQETGNENITVSKEEKIINYSSGVSSENFTVRENGRTSYRFECRDFSGNSDSSRVNLSIDSLEPVVSSSDPGNGSETSREFNLSIFFRNETFESGVNVSASNISVAPGKIDYMDWSNSSVTAGISGLDYSEEFSVEANLSDRVGHRNVSRLDFVTTEDTSSSSEDDSDGSGSSGGGGGSFTETEDTENDTEESENNTSENNSMAPVEKTYRKNLSSSPEKIDTSDSGTSVESAQVSGDGEVEVSISRTESSVEEPETVSKYEEMNITARGAERIEMNLSFTVEKTWFAERDTDPSKTSLYRRNSSRWQELETKVVEEREDVYVYSSRVPGFSTFMIGSEKSNSGTETLDSVKPEDCRRSTEDSANLSHVENCTGPDENVSKAGDNDSQDIAGKIPVAFGVIILVISIYFGNSWRKKAEMEKEVESIRSLVENNPQIESELIEAELSIQNNDFAGAREKISSVREDL